jgi:hypothetical protein
MNINIIHSLLYGKNLCNLLVNKIIEEFKGLNKNHHTQIKVVDVGNFIILKGITDIEIQLNFSNLFSKYIFDLFGIEKSFNVIDLITYGTTPKKNPILINLNFNKKTYLKHEHKKVVDDNLNGLFYNYTAFTDNFLYDTDKTKNYLSKNNIDINLTKIENTVEIFESDDFYGKSIMSSKLYETYFTYISHHIFEKNICDNLNIFFYSDSEIKDINFDNSILKIFSENLLVKEDWLVSLILDVFDLNPKYIIEHLGLNSYDYSNEILATDKRVWVKKDKIGEMILI